MSICALLVVTGLSCSRREKNQEERDTPHQEINQNLKFISYSYDMIAEYVGSDTLDAPGSRYIHYNGEGILPEVLGDDNIRMLRDTLERTAGIEFTDDSTPTPTVGEEQRLTDLTPSSTESCGEVYSRVSASLVNPRVVSFDVLGSSYECLAAHGMNTLTCINYCIADGKILKLSDLIKPGNDKALLKLIFQNLKSREISLQVKESELTIPQSFAVTSDGLDFIYQPYEIAPYSEGIIRASVSLGDLMMGSLLTPEGDFVFNGTRAVSTEK